MRGDVSDGPVHTPQARRRRRGRGGGRAGRPPRTRTTRRSPTSPAAAPTTSPTSPTSRAVSTSARCASPPGPACSCGSRWRSGRNNIVAVTLGLTGSAMQLQVFAAPRTQGIWDELREEISDSIGKQGGTVDADRRPVRHRAARPPARQGRRRARSPTAPPASSASTGPAGSCAPCSPASPPSTRRPRPSSRTSSPTSSSCAAPRRAPPATSSCSTPPASRRPPEQPGRRAGPRRHPARPGDHGDPMSGLGQLLHRLTATREELDAADERRASMLQGATACADVPPRTARQGRRHRLRADLPPARRGARPRRPALRRLRHHRPRSSSAGTTSPVSSPAGASSPRAWSPRRTGGA